MQINVTGQRNGCPVFFRRDCAMKFILIIRAYFVLFSAALFIANTAVFAVDISVREIDWYFVLFRYGIVIFSFLIGRKPLFYFLRKNP